MGDEPKCILCGAPAEMDSPASLCKSHWDMWWAAGAGVDNDAGFDNDEAISRWEHALLRRIEELLAEKSDG
jgi:hypothetical protein